MGHGDYTGACEGGCFLGAGSYTNKQVEYKVAAVTKTDGTLEKRLYRQVLNASNAAIGTAVVVARMVETFGVVINGTSSVSLSVTTAGEGSKKRPLSVSEAIVVRLRNGG